MEYSSLFSNYVQIGSNQQYYNYHGYNTPPRLNSSGSSMDAEIREPLKIKDGVQEDEFFSWPADIRVSLDEERHSYQHHQDQAASSVKHEMCRGQDPTKDYQEMHPKQAKFVRSVQAAKEKEIAGKLLKHQRKSTTEVSAKAELDAYLEKTVMDRNNQSSEAENQEIALPRKRKLEMAWQNNKVRAQRDMVGGRLWQVDDLEIDLSSELSNPAYSMSDALLTLPVFKQESPSPTNGTRDQTSPNRGTPWHVRQQIMINNNNDTSLNNNQNCSADQQNSPALNQISLNNNTNNGNQQGMSTNTGQQNHMPIHSNASIPNSQGLSMINTVVSYTNGLQDSMNVNCTSNNQNMDVANGLLLCSSHASMENYNNCSLKTNVSQMESTYQDNRFQYVLAAATSMATKCNEDTLTYLNQCQSYEIKLKKIGDLSHFKGKILKSVIRICFHERRLQFAEREQMALWQSERPGERIVEVDVPLSYGLIHVIQPTEQPLLNTVEIYWDPVKEAGVYIKVNCISTEFTAKKHGGEKGVPFRIQVETFLPSEGVPGTPRSPNHPMTPDRRLHAAACQIKVFKLKGADRKHKQDREKILRRPPNERDKFQQSYDCTVFTDLSNEAVFSPVAVGTQAYSPEHCSGLGNAGALRPNASSPVSPQRMDSSIHQIGLQTPINEMKYHRLSRANSHNSSLDCEEDPGRSLIQCTLGSPGEITENDIITESSTPFETRTWLSNHRFLNSTQTFGNFSGGDILRLSRDDLIQICGLADGIRLYNALHAERAPARLTLYVKKMSEQQYNAIYLRNCQVAELKKKIQSILQDGGINAMGELFVAGPGNIRIKLTDEVVQNFKNDSTFYLDLVEGGVILILT